VQVSALLMAVTVPRTTWLGTCYYLRKRTRVKHVRTDCRKCQRAVRCHTLCPLEMQTQPENLRVSHSDRLLANALLRRRK
jgi:hypothetical protein